MTLTRPIALALLTLLAVSAAHADDGFVPLFDGKSLDGWTGDPALWRVENGEIVGSTESKKIQSNSFLATTKTFADFVLRVKVKLRNGNSGVQFRSEQLPDYAVAGYQADVAEKTYFGMLYEERKRGILPYWNALPEAERTAVHAAAKPGDWNEYEITCQGDRIKFVLNGKTTVDMADPEGAREGIVALQLHVGDPMEVRFKDIAIKDLAPRYKPDPQADPYDPTALLMPEADQTRTGRVAQFRVPEGFAVEQAASNDVTGSVYQLAFDRLGRPTVVVEDQGVYLLEDADGDGVCESKKSFYNAVKSAMGLHWASPNELLVHGQGPNGPALYKIADRDLDDEGDVLELVLKSRGGIGEHGPHQVLRGPDGCYYIMYGNHAYPKAEPGADSPSRGLEEDHFLPHYVDPRGHATKIRAPGGTIVRLDEKLRRLEQVAGGFRNAYDFAIDAQGELWTYDSDMEWDVGLPWYRPTRIAHVVPGGDYGWRTGSSKMPFYYLDTLPSVFNAGRGSPVGMCTYEHTAYPPRFRGALFLGDWSRGRIRALFPEPAGATYRGTAVDFVVGEPLNVTDMDVGPDGFLYFSVGGRGTHGGVYRVRYGQAAPPAPIASVDDLLRQPMPFSAWAQTARAAARAGSANLSAALLEAAAATSRPVTERIRALTILQCEGPRPAAAFLIERARDADPALRAFAIYLLGERGYESAHAAVEAALDDADPRVLRRACEALVRMGIERRHGAEPSPASARLIALLGHEDRFVRYAARVALERIAPAAWREAVLALDAAAQPLAALEGLAALAHVAAAPEDSDALVARLERLAAMPLDDESLLRWLRVAQLALLRDRREGDPRRAFGDAVTPMLLARFPGPDARVNREIQVLLAGMQRAEATGPMLAYLAPERTQEDQIHTAYCLRAIPNGWTPEQRAAFVAWFDLGRTLPGGASMEGFIDNIWQDALKLLTAEERAAAEARKAEAMAKRQADAMALMAAGPEDKKGASDLAQMSFEELSEFLEYDPMAYRTDIEKGEQVFVRSKCASCHVFGTVGKGGGPDLSTVASRFRRSDLLEAIMFPSRTVSDQYTGVELDLDDLSTVRGMIVTETDAVLTLIDINGTRMDIDKGAIEARRDAQGSTMPEGLLGTMTFDNLIDLINFLERGADL